MLASSRSFVRALILCDTYLFLRFLPTVSTPVNEQN